MHKMTSPTSVVIPAIRKHTATIIFIHGLGDSGAGWVSLAENWRRQKRFEEVKFIFPNAPARPITINMGMTMPGWYDIVHFSDLNASQDEDGIMQSRSYFHNLIASEVSSGIPGDRIVLGGFSQGGAMSLLAGITCSHKLGGVFGLSCYILLHNKIKDLIAEAGNANKNTKIFMGHGTEDPLVKHEWGKLTAHLLTGMGFDVEMKTYPNLVHSTDPKEIVDLGEFLEKRIPEIETTSQK
ncbi:Acyl-protein thioesterase 1 [Golovinomyces cichoracearum]|uniref:Acyl-protein thioesterase 1 n=1 Tax=Golovinomyces cichoracearum TaxID=62708 RepID=A0A420IZ20_9PEZI|nr:Acyl-protein thioesterase 1 [Golovinomyces cichoracearum]